MPVGPSSFLALQPWRPWGVRAMAFALVALAHAAALQTLGRPHAPAVRGASHLVVTVPLAGALSPPRRAGDERSLVDGGREAAAPTADRPVPRPAAARRARPGAVRTVDGVPRGGAGAGAEIADATATADLALRADGQAVTLAAAPSRAGWAVRVTSLAGDVATGAGDAAQDATFDWDDAADGGWQIRLAMDAASVGAEGRWAPQGPTTRRLLTDGVARDGSVDGPAIDPLLATLVMGMAIRGTPTLTRPDTVIELPGPGASRLRYRVVGAEQIEIAGGGREALRLSRIDPSRAGETTLRELWLETAYAWLPLRFDLESDGRVTRVEAIGDLPR